MDAYKSRRLRILESGLSDYTGLVGNTLFENGVSVEHVPWNIAAHLGSSMKMEDADIENYQVNPAADLQRSRELAADDPQVTMFNEGVQLDGEVRLGILHLTREELQAIADKNGLAGVREIARKHGGTGRSIKECIDVVLQHQAAEIAQLKPNETNTFKEEDDNVVQAMRHQDDHKMGRYDIGDLPPAQVVGQGEIVQENNIYGDLPEVQKRDVRNPMNPVIVDTKGGTNTDSVTEHAPIVDDQRQDKSASIEKVQTSETPDGADKSTTAVKADPAHVDTEKK